MKEEKCWKNAGIRDISKRVLASSAYIVGKYLINWCKTLFFLRSIRQELISKNKVESSQEDEEQENHQENISVTTTDSGKGNFRIII